MKRLLQIVGTIVVVVLAGCTLLPLLPVDTWWIRIGDFPRIQLAIAHAVCAVAFIPARKSRLGQISIATMTICLGIQIYWVFAWLPIATNEVEWAESEDRGRRIRILSANVLQPNRKTQEVLDVVKERTPDLVILCEINQRWATELEPLKEQFPFHYLHPLENKYGMAMFSRLPISPVEVKHLVRPNVPSLHFDVTLDCGAKCRVVAIHPNPPRPGQSTTARDAELVVAGRDARQHQNCIVLGDLNDVGWSRTTNLFQEVSGLLDPRKGRGIYPTFDVKSPIWRYPIDHVFHSPTFRVVRIETLRPIGSDHFPLFVELSHEPEAQGDQHAPNLDSGDQEDAEDVVEHGDEYPSL